MTDMKTIFSKLLIIITLITIPYCVVAQNDAFFYENFETMNREGSTGFSFDNFSDGIGLNFGNFNNNLNGFNFGNFGNGGDGLGFGGFDFNGGDVPLDGGLLLLCGFAMLRLKSKDKIRKAMSIEH